MVMPVSNEVLERVHRLELPFNRYGIDPYGVKISTLSEVFSTLSWLYRHYFQVHVYNLENVPTSGRAMLVGNHSGGWALDAIMTMTAVFLEIEPPRLAHGMAEKFLGRVPMVAQMVQGMGGIIGTPENATHLLENERLLLVYPEGAHGTEKLYSERHSLVDFGSGFIRLALRTKTPIIPVAFIGGGEAIPTIINLYGAARRIGVPYIPVTPWGLALPRPATLQIYFGEPMRFDGTGNEEDVVILRWVSQVKDKIRELIAQGLAERPDLSRRSLRQLLSSGFEQLL